MDRVKSFFEIKTQKQFEDFAISTFFQQYRNNSIYKRYCDLIDINLNNVRNLQEIPYLPIIFFKKKKLSHLEVNQNYFLILAEQLLIIYQLII